MELTPLSALEKNSRYFCFPQHIDSMIGGSWNGIAPGIVLSKQKGPTLKEVSSSLIYAQYV